LFITCKRNTDTNVTKYLIKKCQISFHKFNIENINVRNMNFLKKKWLNKFCDKNNLINNIITKNDFSTNNIKIIINYILDNDLKENLISSENFFKKIKFCDLLNLENKGIRINLSISNLKSPVYIFPKHN